MAGVIIGCDVGGGRMGLNNFTGGGGTGNLNLDQLRASGDGGRACDFYNAAALSEKDEDAASGSRLGWR